MQKVKTLILGYGDFYANAPFENLQDLIEIFFCHGLVLRKHYQEAARKMPGGGEGQSQESLPSLRTGSFAQMSLFAG